MKTYSTIPHYNNQKSSYYFFDKLDGSNIRVEWTRKNGFKKFGTRTRLLGEDQGILYSAKSLFLDKYADDLNKLFLKNRWDKVTIFSEFLGPNSFAGVHDEKDQHDIVIFDINIYKHGLIPPKDFIRLFDNIHTAEFLTYGSATYSFIDQVKNSELTGMSLEGSRI